MKASELRIGNYVVADGLHDGKVVIVDGIGEKGSLVEPYRVIKFKESPIGEFIDSIKPIPLTEQWLLHFGFDHMGIIFRKSVTHHLELAYMLSINEFRIQTKGSGFTNTLEIKHVHQLQNLYFALTGEELTIKEKL